MKGNKLKKVITGLALGGIFFTGAPMMPMTMQWVMSYETLGFNTADRDLDLNQYAPTGENSKKGKPTYFIRTVPKNEGRVITTDNIKLLEGKTKVSIACQKCAYYNEFRSQSGAIVREKTTKLKFQNLNKRNAPKPGKLEMISLLGVNKAYADVAYDNATNSGDISNLTSTTWSHTTTGANTYIVVALGGWDSVDTIGDVTITYNGDSLTELGGRQTAGSNNSVIWGGLADTGASLTVSVTNIPASYAELMAGAISFTGVHQSVSTGTLVNDTSETNNPSVDLTLTSGDMGVDILYSGADNVSQTCANEVDPSAGTNETGRIAVNFCAGVDNKKSLTMGTETGTGTVTMDWTDADGYDVSYSAVPLLDSPPPDNGTSILFIRGARLIIRGARTILP